MTLDHKKTFRRAWVGLGVSVLGFSLDSNLIGSIALLYVGIQLYVGAKQWHRHGVMELVEEIRRANPQLTAKDQPEEGSTTIWEELEN